MISKEGGGRREEERRRRELVERDFSLFLSSCRFWSLHVENLGSSRVCGLAEASSEQSRHIDRSHATSHERGVFLRF